MLQPENLALLIPIIALMIPIVAILVKHQQRMAEIIHQGGGGIGQPMLIEEIRALRSEVAELRHQVNAQTLELDSISSQRKTPSQLGS